MKKIYIYLYQITILGIGISQTALLYSQTGVLKSTPYTIGVCSNNQCTNSEDSCSTNTDCKGFTMQAYDAGCITQNTQFTITFPPAGTNPYNSYIYTFTPTVGVRAGLQVAIALQACSRSVPCPSPSGQSYETGYGLYVLRDGEAGAMQQGWEPEYPACWTMVAQINPDPGQTSQVVTVTPEGSVIVHGEDGQPGVTLPISCFVPYCPNDTCCYAQPSCGVAQTGARVLLIKEDHLKVKAAREQEMKKGRKLRRPAARREREYREMLMHIAHITEQPRSGAKRKGQKVTGHVVKHHARRTGETPTPLAHPKSNE